MFRVAMMKGEENYYEKMFVVRLDPSSDYTAARTNRHYALQISFHCAMVPAVIIFKP